MIPSFKDRTEAMIFHGYVGDSLGIPVEMKTKDEICAILNQRENSSGKMNDFLPPTLHDLYRNGNWDTTERVISSDDTYGSRAFIQSINIHNRIDWEDIASKLLESYRKKPFGYGGTTKQAYQNLTEGKSYLECGVNGWGNGTVMKLGSFSAYIHSRNLEQEDAGKLLEIFCKMTHTHPAVIYGTYVHHKILSHLLDGGSINEIQSILRQELQKRNDGEAEISISKVFEKLLGVIETGQIETMSDEEILEVFGWGDASITKTSGRIDITLGICYSIFLRNPSFQGLIDAVSIGGDTDTYGSIVGNLVGAYTGLLPPDKYIREIPEYQEIKEETQTFLSSLRKEI